VQGRVQADLTDWLRFSIGCLEFVFQHAIGLV
jgi:hypothetical protein